MRVLGRSSVSALWLRRGRLDDIDLLGCIVIASDRNFHLVEQLIGEIVRIEYLFFALERFVRDLPLPGVSLDLGGTT